MDSKKLSLFKKFDSIKGKQIIIICGILGLLLIFISGITDIGSNNDSYVSGTVKEYKSDIQQELKDMLYKIEGVGNVEVLLTIESSVEGVYLENNSTKTMEKEPVIRGVIVACQGGDEPLVVERVLNAVTKSLNISGAKVCVTKLKE